MITADQIPDEVFYAFQKAWTNKDTLSTKECIAAALSAWPGAGQDQCDNLILPLPNKEGDA